MSGVTPFRCCASEYLAAAGPDAGRGRGREQEEVRPSAYARRRAFGHRAHAVRLRTGVGCTVSRRDQVPWRCGRPGGAGALVAPLACLAGGGRR
jgi:hypothetical protein